MCGQEILTMLCVLSVVVVSTPITHRQLTVIVALPLSLHFCVCFLQFINDVYSNLGRDV